MTDYQYRPGGLMRCCTLTLAKAFDPFDESVSGPDQVEGSRLPCRHCSSVMAFRDGAWEWDKARANPYGNAS